jgi:hypothetical protein
MSGRSGARWTRGGRCTALVMLAGLLLYPWLGQIARALPAADERTGLPVGSELDEDAIDSPREVFHSEALHGRKSYLSNLGNLAFNSPSILGDAARKAHMSCGSCHVNGASNPKLFIPGLSTRPGNFDTTNALFNPKKDNGVLDPLVIPSLRGARLLAPYGHDGRSATLRDFVSNVIVNEFAGAPPSRQILDAIVAYIEDIDFLPNPALDKVGRLEAGATAAERRGERLFTKPFPHDPTLSCAGCHVPSSAFVDHRKHDVGSGGLYKTPTLLNDDFNAPYFHDGRFDTYSEVIDHFDRVFDLRLTAEDRSDLLAYLSALGNGTRPAYHLTGTNVLSELNEFASVLDTAIDAHDAAVITLTVQSVGAQLEDLADHYPDPTGPVDADAARALVLARATITRLIEALDRVESNATAGQFEAAAGAYLDYRKLTAGLAPLALQTAEPWSLFNPTLHAAHFHSYPRPAMQRTSDGHDSEIVRR